MVTQKSDVREGKCPNKFQMQKIIFVIQKMPVTDRLMQHSVCISNACFSFAVHIQYMIRIHVKDFDFVKCLLSGFTQLFSAIQHGAAGNRSKGL